MSELLQQAIARVRQLPASTQDDAAQLLLDWVGDLTRDVDERSPETTQPDDRAAIEEGLADARAGRVASEAEIEAAFAVFRLDR